MFTSLPTKRHRVAAWSFAGRGAGRFARRVDGDAEESGMSTDGTEQAGTMGGETGDVPSGYLT